MSLRVCHNVYIPLRESPSHRSEMTSQILFGERFGIVESASNWLKVVTLFDSFTGWIDGSQAITQEWDPAEKGIITGRELRCIRPDRSVITLMPGSELFRADLATGTFLCADEEWQLVEKPYMQSVSPAGTVIETAMQFLNTPYLWGGRTTGGIDCSGLVQVVYKIHGVQLPRNAAEQAETGEIVSFIEEALPGDLLFFSCENEAISHVALFIAPGKVLHSSGTVKTDTVDHQGIWSADKGKYTHFLRTIRRIRI
ncbi:MAG TPA: C40 family peptidase [Bacteroidales bacterium]|nr:C40 family peptidase [Bacteroidales bacterium]